LLTAQLTRACFFETLGCGLACLHLWHVEPLCCYLL
jgi:hypothetical protein